MTINITQQLEAALREQAQRRGVEPEVLAIDTLRERFLPNRSPIEPQDEMGTETF